ncbi:HdeD family acid-resistance protein [Bacillus sp. 1P06AnD]|uniref:HdeD family acid-resistance protein n=1 Tax=Bacillus sp. 1P06AnD TaxID=3132208 RepID=UPI0039A375C8
MNTFSRILILVSGILMIGLGFWFMVDPSVTLAAFTVFIGLLMMVSGIFHIIMYFYHRKYRRTSGWVLADGILTLLLGIVLVADQISGTLALAYLFSFWVLFSGLLRVIGAFEARDFDIPYWGWIMAAGIIGILIGFMALFNPIIAAIGIAFIIGAFFIVQGIFAIVTFYYLTKYMRRW